MIRQAIRFLAVWFFENRDVHKVRTRVSGLLLRFWPSHSRAEIPECVMCVVQTMSWRRLDAELDLNPDSGRAFVGRRILRSREVEKWPIEYSGSTDLFAHLIPRPVRREPALVLYAGAQTGLAGFVAGILPRFFSLGRLGVPQDILLLLCLEMGRTRIFQDALIDQLFAPRPLELMRKHRLVRVESLHEISSPDVTKELLLLGAQRIAEIYGPFETGGRPVILCGGGVKRAEDLLSALPFDLQRVMKEQAIVINPFAAPLKQTLHALAGASIVVASDGEERALLALVPSQQRTLHEVAVYGRSDPLTQLVLSTINAVGVTAYHSSSLSD